MGHAAADAADGGETRRHIELRGHAGDLVVEAALQQGVILARAAILLAQQVELAFERHKFGRAMLGAARLLAVIIALGDAVDGGLNALERAQYAARGES